MNTEQRDKLTSWESGGSMVVRIGIADVDGVIRGKTVSMEKFKSILEDGFGFCNVVFGWDSADKVYDKSLYTGWDFGYPDSMVKIDLATVREIPWLDRMPFILGDFSGDVQVGDLCPRTLLKKCVKKAESMGFTAMFGAEYEWFNFEETPNSLAEKGGINPKPMTSGNFGYSILRSSLKSSYFKALIDGLTQFGIPIEGIHTETGDGVYEAAIKYSTALEAADRACLFKTSVKEIAYQHGVMASFMAKWSASLPGSGGHLHQSLSDDSGRNLFYDAEDKNSLSQLGRQYLAGMLHCLPHILPMFAPTVNSYKRFVSGSWAAVSADWGIDNRTTAIRLIPGGPKSTRIEMRVPGADANPYLAVAACLASGLYGIEHKLELNLPPISGNAYLASNKTPLDSNLLEATHSMEQSALSTELFGERFTKHFIHTRKWEWQQFEKSVTDWELKRYFEII